MHDVLVNDDVGNPGVEVKVLDDARSTEIDEFGSQWEFQNAVSENKEFCCFQTSEFGIGNEARQGDGASMSKPLAQPHSVEEDQEQSTKVYGSATATTTSQLQTPNAMQDVMNQLTVMQEQMTSVEQKLSVMQEQMTKMEQAQKLNYDAFNQLQNSVNSKLEAIPEQIKDALKEECNVMFEKVMDTLQKGMAEHTTAPQQLFEQAHSSAEASSSTSSATQTQSRELAPGRLEGETQVVPTGRRK